MGKYAILLGSFYGFSAVVLGAFGSHALKKHLSEKMLASFQIGTKYQLIHAVFLVVLGMLFQQKSSFFLNSSIGLASIGILFFSGSIYALVLLQWKFLGPITPIGGLCLILSWLFLGIHAAKSL